MIAAIRTEGLSKRYANGTLALDAVNLTVSHGELLVILGPNGAGKTTLVRQLTTELRPSGGTIEIFGVDAVRKPQRVKEFIGVVPQEAELFEHLTVSQHLYYFALFRGARSQQAKIAAREVLRELELDTRSAVAIKNLSGGLKRRTLVGLALIMNPPLLILDEPTAGLDPESRRGLWDVLIRRKTAGTTILITTHYLEEAEGLADRIAIVSQGKLIALGRLDELGTRKRSIPAEKTNLTQVYFQLVRGDS
ncbi:MAG TPA: ABC transporter ATP-binding protein [Acidobacteriota bacterium]|jgi:ABC-2 type transport system ATP-binding protein